MLELYKFTDLKNFLIESGINIGCFDSIELIHEDFNKQYKEGKITFEGDFINYLGDNKIKRPGYVYKEIYDTVKHGMPRKHIIKCQIIREFIKNDLFDSNYVFSNKDEINVIDKYTRKTFYNQKLDLCKYCKKELSKKWGKEYNDIDELINKLFKNIKKSKNIEEKTDIFGYNTKWYKISKKLREEKEYTCECCHYKARSGIERQYIEVHHKNRNKSDNSKNNLTVLCTKCHSEIDEIHKSNFSKGNNQIKLEKFIRILSSRKEENRKNHECMRKSR